MIQYSYISGGNTGETPQGIARKRDIADQIMGRYPGRITNIGEGIGDALGHLGDTFRSRNLNQQADAGEKAGQASANEALRNYFGGMITGAIPPGTPPPPQASAPRQPNPLQPQTSNQAMGGPAIPQNVAAAEGDLSSGGMFAKRGSGATAAEAANVSQATASRSPIDLASSLIGKGEKPDNATLREYLNNGGVNIDPATTAWCAAYVNATLAQSGIEGTGSGMARSFLNWGEKVDTPERGDVVVLPRGNPNGPYGHVGFFDGANEDGTIRVLAGNQGNAVSIANYRPNQVLGYRRAPAAGSQAPVQVASLGGGIPSGGATAPAPAPQQMAQAQSAPAPQQDMMSSPPSMGHLMQLINNPWVPEGMKRYALEQFQEQQRKASSEYRLEQERAQADLEYRRAQTDALRNPAPEVNKVEADVAARSRVAESMGMAPGSPAYESYVLTGKMPREDQQPLTATDKKAILEADEAIAANRASITNLNTAMEASPQANSGLGASWRAWAGNALPDALVPDFISSPESSAATARLENITTGNALESLKAVFGGAPTEGERKILLEIQGSASQPDHIRQDIFRRAQAAAERRLKFNEDRAAQMRAGTYYQTQPAQPSTATGTAPATGAEQGPRRISSPEEFNTLPSGAQFVAPDGSIRRKP